LSNNNLTASDTKLGGKRAWLVWSLAATAFAYAFLHRVAPGVMVHDSCFWSDFTTPNWLCFRFTMEWAYGRRGQNIYAG